MQGFCQPDMIYCRSVFVHPQELIMITLDDALGRLQIEARPDQLAGMERFGMAVQGRLGLSMPVMRKIAGEFGRDHSLALAMWQTGLVEARIVASIIADPQQVDAALMDAWVRDFNSWDVCDQVCDNLFEKVPLAWQKVSEWSTREEEFVKRAAYALLACLAWHDKKALDAQFITLLPVIRQGATDKRNYVKKAVSWVLRNIGKRNPALNWAAIQEAREIQGIDSPAARWIASDVLRELESEAVQRRVTLRAVRPVKN
jgi:3-methyladenine DNA glycosylase AlkD